MVGGHSAKGGGERIDLGGNVYIPNIVNKWFRIWIVATDTRYKTNKTNNSNSDIATDIAIW